MRSFIWYFNGRNKRTYVASDDVTDAENLRTKALTIPALGAARPNFRSEVTTIASVRLGLRLYLWTTDGLQICGHADRPVESFGPARLQILARVPLLQGIAPLGLTQQAASIPTKSSLFGRPRRNAQS